MGHKYYDVLNVSQGCSKEELKKAYKKLAFECHPDKGGDPEKFKEVAQAYEVLNDDDKRRQYDQLGDEGFQNGNAAPQHMDPHSIFEQFFGGMGGGGFHPFFGESMFHGQNQRRSRRKCRTVQHVIQISNRDAFFGGHRTLKISIQKRCFKCMSDCKNCQGKGSIHGMQRVGPFTTMTTQACHICQGSGKVAEGKPSCMECKGRGEYTEEKIIDLQIPKGVAMGHQVVFDGFGEQPHLENDIPGDLIFEIFVQPDPMFERDGLDLIYKQKISFKDSIIGKKIQIPHYEEMLTVDVSEFGILQPNKNYLIPNKGMESNGKRGHLVLKFTIDYPTKPLSEDLKQKLEELLNQI